MPPRNRFVSFPCSGVLNEAQTPSQVGGSGLTATQNLIYHRNGSWGKRTGTTRFQLPNGPTQTPVSGFRWYRAWPSPLTQLVVYAQGKLSMGNTPSTLSPIGPFALSGTQPPDFCSARDPQAGSAGADVLIITGLVLPNGSFATGDITITGLPSIQPGNVYITVTVSNGTNSVTTPKYYILGTDDPASIAAQLCILINETAAFLAPDATPPYPPFIGEAYSVGSTPPVGNLDSSGQGQSGCAVPTATIFLGARRGGNAGNGYTYSVTLSGTSGGNGTPLMIATQNQGPVASGTLNDTFSGGGQPWSGPARFNEQDGIVEGLSFMAPNAFSGCVTWHDHVWFWGDPNNPDTVFASDILQPECFTYMIENGPSTGPGVGKMTSPNNGGYAIGEGDGDPNVQACVPVGNALYVLKTASIYMFEGYDFQAGEYSFSVTPQIMDHGIPSPDCVDALENELIFWDGRSMMRLAVGSYELEHIGAPIPFTEGYISNGNQQLMKVIAGDFQVEVALNNQYGIYAPFAGTSIIYRSMALFAFDRGSAAANTIAVYDDEASNTLGQYAWTNWSGWNVGAWIMQGSGPNPGGTDVDNPYLYYIDPQGQFLYRVGGNATSDAGNPIPWMAQTGFVTFATPELLKNATRLFLNVEATAGANLMATIVPGRIIPPQPNQILPYGTKPQTIAFNPTIAPANAEALNTLEQMIFNPNLPGAQPIQADSVLVQFTEDGTSFAGLEMLSWGTDLHPEEAFQ
jgi:hypothetical protein